MRPGWFEWEMGCVKLVPLTGRTGVELFWPTGSYILSVIIQWQVSAAWSHLSLSCRNEPERAQCAAFAGSRANNYGSAMTS